MDIKSISVSHGASLGSRFVFIAPRHLVVEPRSRRQITTTCRLGSPDLKLNFPHFLDESYGLPVTHIPTFLFDGENKIERFVV